MNGYEVIECLAKAFSQNQLYALRKNLAEDCVYSSQYAKASVSGADNIIEWLGTVYSNLKEGDEYTYEIIDLKSILQEGVLPQDLCVNQAIYACEYAILMYQFTDKKLVAVTWCTLDDNGKINGIFLSRDKSKFNLHFHGEELETDDPYDLPDTVKPLSENVIKSNHGYSDFFDIRINNTSVEDSKYYIWRKADEFMKEWLPCRGYSIIKSTIFTDCIGYRCKRKGTNYTVYLYAYGNKETTAVNAETCKKLHKLTFSDDSIILVVYVNVDRYMLADTVAYKIRNYRGEEEYEPDFWQLTEIQGKRIAVSFIGAELMEPICIPALVYYPRKEIMDLTFQFMYAFNREDCDVYDCILEDEPSIKGKIGPGEYSGYIKGDAFYNVLRNIHIQYGDMMLGYVRYDDATYSAVPYVDGCGYFGWTVYGNNRMDNFIFHKFQDCEYKDFIKTDKQEAGDLFDYVPKLISARPLPPVESERFAVLLQFDNGECKKYVLTIYDREAKQEAVSCRQHVFSDGIWQSAAVVASHPCDYKYYPECGPALTFKNGFIISGMRCYLNSVPYSEPQKTDEVVYEEDKFRIRKLWSCKANSAREDEKTGILQFLLTGTTYNGSGKSTFATIDGDRLTSLEFDFMYDFEDGVSRVGIYGRGYGFVDKDMRFITPMKYNDADDFSEGYAKVANGNEWLFVDKNGNEIHNTGKNGNRHFYYEVADFHEGMCAVSAMKPDEESLARHSDYADMAGMWGFVNTEGKEVIKTGYIIANDFENGIAIVAKGKSVLLDIKHGLYDWEGELWGGIDKDGNEVIPLKFDEIKYFYGCRENIYRAHYGGWKKGKWGVIDKNGNWLAEPVFDEILNDYSDGLISFYDYSKEDEWHDYPVGIYDLKQKKLLFDAIFNDVDFLDNGDICVEVHEAGRKVEKVIDRNGNERFKSVYSVISTCRAVKDAYEVCIRGKDGDSRGLIDFNGNVIVPCQYDIPYNGFSCGQRLYKYECGGKLGIKDYDGNIVIPAKYASIYRANDYIYKVQAEGKDKRISALLNAGGEEIFPTKYDMITICKDGKHFICESQGICEMYILEEK